jgi:ribonuclease HII
LKKKIGFAVASISHEEIDRINIEGIYKQCYFVTQLKPKPQLLLIDGNYFVKYKRMPHRCIIKEMAFYPCAASILQKLIATNT